VRALTLRTEPSVRQTNAILTRIERELSERGAVVARAGAAGLRFTMPPPWTAPRLAITSGRTTMSAGAGERWKVRYELSFAVLRGIVVVLSLVVVALGWTWPRTTLVNALVGLWAGVYGIPYLLAGRQFRRIIEAAAREVVERRRTPRGEAATGPISLPDDAATPPTE
jgi:hypothetical protein